MGQDRGSSDQREPRRCVLERAQGNSDFKNKSIHDLVARIDKKRTGSNIAYGLAESLHGNILALMMNCPTTLAATARKRRAQPQGLRHSTCPTKSGAVLGHMSKWQDSHSNNGSQ
jgi:hypothetical protein